MTPEVGQTDLVLGMLPGFICTVFYIVCFILYHMPILFIFILPYVLPIQLLGCHNIINVCLLSLKYKHSIVISLKANRVLVLVFWTYYVVHYTAQQNNHVTVTAVQIHEPFHLPLHSAASFLPCEHMRARAVLGVVILSVCLPHAWIMAKLNDSLLIF